MSEFEEKLNELNNTADTTAEYDPQDIEQNKIFAILAYISWLVLVPIFVAKDSKFAKFHVNQGLVLAIVEIICWVAFGILRKLPLIGWIFGLAEGIISFVCFLVAVIGIINAANGKAKELPVIGKAKIFK